MSAKTILILTVGGSHQPILKSIEAAPTAHIHFLCSQDQGRAKGSYLQVIGEGKILKSRPDLPGPDLPNIATLAKLEPERFHVHQIAHFDNLSDCYLDALRIIEQSRGGDPEARVVVDYTGGTKSMSAGLAAAALDDGRCEIRLVSGMRANLDRVSDRSEFVRPVGVLDLQARRGLAHASVFLERYDYASAARVLEDTLARYTSQEMEQRVATACSLCRAFDAWDRFDHRAARQLFDPIGRGVVDEYKAFLCAVSEKKGHGFELVEDLLRNVERRAAQGRYDDAVGRLYRAVELAAQQWLKLRHEIDTGNVALERVPESARGDWIDERGKPGEPLKMGLRNAWTLIRAFPDDPLGAAFSTIEKSFLDFLAVRNQSLFAHGTSPVSESDYARHAVAMQSFLSECIELAVAALGKKRVLRLPQFPQRLPD